MDLPRYSFAIRNLRRSPGRVVFLGFIFNEPRKCIDIFLASNFLQEPSSVLGPQQLGKKRKKRFFVWFGFSDQNLLKDAGNSFATSHILVCQSKLCTLSRGSGIPPRVLHSSIPKQAYRTLVFLGVYIPGYESL